MLNYTLAVHPIGWTATFYREDLKMKTNEIYQTVTDTIIELLESHQENNFERPWILMGQDGDYARNPTTGKYYRGINQLLLSTVLLKREYLNNTWMTFNQIKTLGGHVLKGEKSTPIIFYKTAYKSNDKKYIAPATYQNMSTDEQTTIDTIPVLKLYRVFNVSSQTEGLDHNYYDAPSQEPLQDFEKDDKAEQLIHATGIDVEIIKGNQAYYDRTADKVRIPLREQFKGQIEPYYAVVFHELAHATGSPKRLNRKKGETFGDVDYAKEELVAELTSAFVCASLGFSKTITNNVAYIKSWLGALKQDTKAVVRAANQAQKAADYILDGTPFAIPKLDITN